MTTITTKYPFVGNIISKTGGRDENQDCAGFVDTALGLLLVVCDGAGGGPGGKTASHLATETILNELSGVAEHTSRHDALKYGIEKANDAIYSHAMENPQLRGMATTIVALLINENSAVMAHVGDSRIYQLRKGSIVFRSNDHSYVADLVRQHKLTEEEARNHPQSNRITRALGIKPTIEAEFDEVPFRRGDRFVLCTDGIWGAMPQKELVKSLSRVMGIQELTSSVAAHVDQIGQNGGGGHDNLTLALLDATFKSSQSERKPLFKWLPVVVAVIMVIAAAVIVVILTRNQKPVDNETYSKPVLSLPLDKPTTTNPTPQTTAPDNDNPQKNPSNSEPLVQETPATEATTDNASPQLFDEHDMMAHNVQGNMQHTFEDLSAEERKMEKQNQINDLIDKLGRLKTMRAGSPQKLQMNKELFLKDSINPRLQVLALLVPTNMADVRAIRKLLDDNKEKATRASRGRRGTGEPDRECNQFIDEVIDKLKALKENGN